MSDSTRRALRTAYQGLLAAAVILPVVATALAGTPIAAQVAFAVMILGVVSKVINELEDRGLIPAWLKGQDSV